MKPRSFAGMNCSIAGALELIGDRWTILIIRDLSFGLARFEDLRASTGIPTATLSARLKHLVETTVVERIPYSEKPTRTEYRLTPKGRDLWKVTVALREWGDRWNATGLGAQPVDLVDRKTGKALRLALVDEEGRAVSRERAMLVPGPAADQQIRSRFASAEGNN